MTAIAEFPQTAQELGPTPTQNEFGSIWQLEEHPSPENKFASSQVSGLFFKLFAQTAQEPGPYPTQNELSSI